MIKLREPIEWEEGDVGEHGQYPPHWFQKGEGLFIELVPRRKDAHSAVGVYRVTFYGKLLSELDANAYTLDQAKARAEEMLLEFGNKIFIEGD